jgi:hypothetical protein
VILPSRDGADRGGSGGTIFDDQVGVFSYRRDHANPFPAVVTAIDEMNVDVRYFGDHEHGFDTIAEIPGTDPKSWWAGTSTLGRQPAARPTMAQL